jgi:hypothetical protein
MQPLPPKVDGVSQDSIKEGPYQPRGVLAHEYFPLETVIVTEYGNDLSYTANYFSVSKIWRLYIPDNDLYERLRNKLLQQRVVVVDYTDMSNLGIYLPKTKHFNGIDELFKTALGDLRELDRESLDRHLSEVGHRTVDDVLKSHYDRF